MSTLMMSITNLDQLQPNVIVRHTFDCKGGTIGSEGASWLMNDRNHSVASIHCEIRWIEDSFCVIDRCARTYLNDSINSLGARSPRRLLEGDQLRIGAYRLLVQHSQEHANARSLEDLLSPDASVLDRLIADPPANGGCSSTTTQAITEICSAFETHKGNDPLVALNAVGDTSESLEDPLQRLIAGARP